MGPDPGTGCIVAMACFRVSALTELPIFVAEARATDHRS